MQPARFPWEGLNKALSVITRCVRSPLRCSLQHLTAWMAEMPKMEEQSAVCLRSPAKAGFSTAELVGRPCQIAEELDPSLRRDGGNSRGF